MDEKTKLAFEQLLNTIDSKIDTAHTSNKIHRRNNEQNDAHYEAGKFDAYNWVYIEIKELLGHLTPQNN